MNLRPQYRNVVAGKAVPADDRIWRDSRAGKAVPAGIDSAGKALPAEDDRIRRNSRAGKMMPAGIESAGKAVPAGITVPEKRCRQELTGSGGWRLARQ